MRTTMPKPEPFDARRSTAILVGTSTYTGGLTSFAAADNSLVRMRALLGERCGWLPERIHLFRDKNSADPVLRDIARLIHETDDAVLFYYVGHGQLIRGRQDLGLALADTSTDRSLRRSTSLRLSDVKRELEDCECRIRLLMLDCCYSGIAVGNTQGVPELAEEIHHISQAEGVFTLTACRFNEQAYYQQGDGGLTYFTKYRADIVEEGIAGPQQWLTGNAIYDALAQRFHRLRDPAIPALPRPEVSARGRAGEFPFARNRAWRPAPPAAAVEASARHAETLGLEWVEHDRFIAERLRIAATVTSPWPLLTEQSAARSSRMGVVVYQNEYLAPDQREVNAMISVAREARKGAMRQPSVIYIIDCAESMGTAGKLDAAKVAVKGALSALRDGCRFAVIAGRDAAELVYPNDGSLAVADRATRAEAAAAVEGLRAGGRREFGLWLTRAARLFLTDSGQVGQVRKALLITDGRDGRRHPAQIADAIRACVGIFSCDCRGVGTDWTVAELRAIASGLLGTVDIIADPARVAEELSQWTAQTMQYDVAEVALRLWTPQGAEVRSIRQVSPDVVDLSGLCSAVDAMTGDYPTGAWTTETRDYQVCIDVQPGEVGQEKLVGRVNMITPDGDHVLSMGEGRIRAVWTDDHLLAGRIDRQVGRYNAQTELAEAIRQGLEDRSTQQPPQPEQPSGSRWNGRHRAARRG